MLKGPVLSLALLLCAPALWGAFSSQSLGPMTVMSRFMVAILVAALMLSFLRSVTKDYRKAAARREMLAKLPPDVAEQIIEG